MSALTREELVNALDEVVEDALARHNDEDRAIAKVAQRIADALLPDFSMTGISNSDIVNDRVGKMHDMLDPRGDSMKSTEELVAALKAAHERLRRAVADALVAHIPEDHDAYLPLYQVLNEDEPEDSAVWDPLGSPSIELRPIITVTNDDLINVLAGTTMGVMTLDGVDVNLRLATPDELERQMVAASEKVGIETVPPGGWRAHAERLTQSLDLNKLVNP